MAIDSFTNNASTTLSSSIADGTTTTIHVVSAAPFPGSGQYRIIIDSELLLVTGGQGTTTWTVTRGVEGTAGAAHASGANVVEVLTAAALTGTFMDMGTNQTVAGNKHFTGTTTLDASTITAPAISSPTFSGTAVVSTSGLVDTASTQTLTGKAIQPYLKALNASQSISGNPGLSVVFLFQSGTFVALPSGSGGFSFSFPSAFNTGVSTIILSNGDSAAATDVVIAIQFASINTSGFSGQLNHASTNAAFTNNVRINYFAVGW